MVKLTLEQHNLKYWVRHRGALEGSKMVIICQKLLVLNLVLKRPIFVRLPIKYKSRPNRPYFFNLHYLNGFKIILKPSYKIITKSPRLSVPESTQGGFKIYQMGLNEILRGQFAIVWYSNSKLKA